MRNREQRGWRDIVLLGAGDCCEPAVVGFHETDVNEFVVFLRGIVVSGILLRIDGAGTRR